MKIKSVSYSISYISYIVDYVWRASKLVIVRAETHTCLNRVILLKDEFKLSRLWINLGKRYSEINHRSWKEFKTDIPYL